MSILVGEFRREQLTEMTVGEQHVNVRIGDDRAAHAEKLVEIDDVETSINSEHFIVNLPLGGNESIKG